MAEVKPEIETAAKIKVVGVGGGGGAALTRMIKDQLQGVDFIAVNTDIQALQTNPATNKISIGKTITRGLGAGMNPEVGRRAAEENANEIRNAVNGADMVFLTAGLGGGTGSGALPEVAKIAKEAGALTVAVVTKPFSFEGAQRRRIADDAYNQLAEHVDTIITIPNDRVLQIIDKNTTMKGAFKIVDDVLKKGVQGIADMITVPGEINVDFADVKTIMTDSGSALMGIGEGTGENRAVEAAKAAIASPLLELSIDGAKGILFAVAGSEEIGMYEVTEAANVVTGSADEDAHIIWGTYVDESLGDSIRITVVATGFDAHERRRAPGLAGDTHVMPQTSWNTNQTTQVRESMKSSDDNSSAKVSNSPFGKKPVRDKEVDFRQNEESVTRKVGNDSKNLFNRRRVQTDEYVNDEDYESQQDEVDAPRVNKSVQNRNSSMNSSDDSDDDFGVPAFIRRKMM